MSSRVLFTPVKREFLVVQRASNSAGNSLRITGDLRLSQSSNIKPCSPQDGGRRARGCVPGRHVVGPAAARGVASPLPRGSCELPFSCSVLQRRNTDDSHENSLPGRGGAERDGGCGATGWVRGSHVVGPRTAKRRCVPMPRWTAGSADVPSESGS